MDKSASDKAEFHGLIRSAVAELDAIGARPIGERGPFGRRSHPDAEAWEVAVTAVGVRFHAAAASAAERGNSVAEGYLVEQPAAQISARWAEAIRAMI